MQWPKGYSDSLQWMILTQFQDQVQVQVQAPGCAARQAGLLTGVKFVVFLAHR